MQRFYSTFARGGPGVGLVLMRLGTGILLIYLSLETLLGAGAVRNSRLGLDVLGGVAGIALIVGLWTPIAGCLLTVTQLLLLFCLPFSQLAYPVAHILLSVQGAGLALLGPGAWSIDARLYGRKRLIPQR